MAKKLRYRLREVRSRDIFDIAVALQNDRNMLKNIIKSGMITLDQFVEWKNAVENSDMEKYKQSMEKMTPADNTADIILHTKEIISDAVGELRSEIIMGD